MEKKIPNKIDVLRIRFFLRWLDWIFGSLSTSLIAKKIVRLIIFEGYMLQNTCRKTLFCWRYDNWVETTFFHLLFNESGSMIYFLWMQSYAERMIFHCINLTEQSRAEHLHFFRACFLKCKLDVIFWLVHTLHHENELVELTF